MLPPASFIWKVEPLWAFSGASTSSQNQIVNIVGQGLCNKSKPTPHTLTCRLTNVHMHYPRLVFPGRTTLYIFAASCPQLLAPLPSSSLQHGNNPFLWWLKTSVYESRLAPPPTLSSQLLSTRAASNDSWVCVFHAMWGSVCHLRC